MAPLAPTMGTSTSPVIADATTWTSAATTPQAR